VTPSAPPWLLLLLLVLLTGHPLGMNVCAKLAAGLGAADILGIVSPSRL
jgi:hypothetical protein